MLIAYLVAGALAAQPCHVRKKNHLRCSTAVATKDPGLMTERVLRRRVVRMARLAFLERRQAQLAEFLRQVNTERPLFRENRAVTRSGIEIGPTSATRDFLGDSIVRAGMRASESAPAVIMLTVRARAKDGRSAEASVIVRLPAGTTARAVEVQLPLGVAPVSIDWTVMRL